MSLNSAAIAAGIAALTVSGVTIKDISNIPEAVTPRDLPMLYPSPNNWKNGGTSEPSTGALTFGPPTGRTWLFNRIYKYVYLHAPAGAGRSIAENYTALSAKEDAIVEALTALDLANVDVKQIEVADYGVLEDSAGSKFYGFTVTLTLREYLNG